MKKPQGKKKHTLNRIALVLIAVIALLTILQIATLAYVAKLRNEIEKSMGVDALPAFIARSEFTRYKDPVINVAEKRAYIPGARLYLPVDDEMPIFKYDYHEFAEGATLSLSLPGAIGYQKPEDDHRCDKMIIFSDTDTPGSGYELIKEIRATKDGFKYIYVHTPGTCSIYTDELYATARDIASKLISY